MSAEDFLRDRPGFAKQVKEELRQLLARSATDAAFRKKLLEDPRTAVEEFTGLTLPPDFDLTFIESQADATIVLPKFVASDPELPSEDIDDVHGGVHGGISPDMLRNPAVAHLITSLLAIAEPDRLDA